MVARKTNNGKKQPKRTQQPKARVPRAMAQPAVEKAVRDYIALLKDPCNGPLVGPVGATANGYITRFEATINVNPAQPNWALRWTPGCLNTTAGNGAGLQVEEAATGTGTPILIRTNVHAPGYSFLSGTAANYRCLAACAQVRYTDTEVNRRGVIGSTISSGLRAWANIDQALSVTVDRARIPDQALEVLWQPSDGDETFVPIANVPDDETRGRKHAIFLAGTGCTTAAVSIRLVVVYQWTPQSDDNIVLPVPMPGTGVTMARIVLLARQAGFVAGHLLKGYATGGLYGVAREAASMIKPSIKAM